MNVFAFLLLIVIPASILWMVWVARPKVSTVEHETLCTPSELAWAVGGPARTRAMWWAALQANSHLMKDLTPYSQAFYASDRGPDESDHWLFEAWRVLPESPVSEREVNRLWTTVLADLHAHLVHRRIVVSDSFVTHRQQLSMLGMMVIMALVPLSFLVTNQPLTAGVVIMSMMVIAGIVGMFAVGGGISRVTTGGRAWRDRHVTSNEVATRAPQSDSLGMAVAIGGLAVLAGTPFEALAAPPAAVRGDSGSGGCGGAAVAAGGCGSGSGASSSSSGGGFATGGSFGGGDSSSGGGDGGGGGGGCGGCGS